MFYVISILYLFKCVCLFFNLSLDKSFLKKKFTYLNFFFLMLYMIYENTFNGYSVYSLDLLYLLAILLGISVIISKNPIVSVLFLIGLFLSIAGYLILTGLNFIGLSYLLVYIGAVSILFIFILMLINVRVSELITETINSIPLTILVSLFFSVIIYKILPLSSVNMANYINKYINTINTFFNINNYYYFSTENEEDDIEILKDYKSE